MVYLQLVGLDICTRFAKQIVPVPVYSLEFHSAYSTNDGLLAENNVLRKG